mmetsp:Transcript_52215/g.150350  ORF Transcript_52215/g.150350 Transcript_52215/m.150350 type:complete len:223 (+) Transcript_52215:235-903(+)
MEGARVVDDRVAGYEGRADEEQWRRLGEGLVQRPLEAHLQLRLRHSDHRRIDQLLPTVRAVEGRAVHVRDLVADAPCELLRLGAVEPPEHRPQAAVRYAHVLRHLRRHLHLDHLRPLPAAAIESALGLAARLVPRPPEDGLLQQVGRDLRGHHMRPGAEGERRRGLVKRVQRHMHGHGALARRVSVRLLGFSPGGNLDDGHEVEDEAVTERAPKRRDEVRRQ